MNATIRNLIIAAPLATAAFTLVPAAAMAAEPGPVIVLAPHTDPKPELDFKAPAPEPVEPKGPQDKAPVPQPVEPKGPQDKAPVPQPNDPEGPGGVFTNPEPCPTHGVDCTPDKGEPNEPAEPKGTEPNGGNSDVAADSADVADAVRLPTRIDAGLAAPEHDGGLELAWLFAGGLAVTASGTALAVRKRQRRTA